MQLIDSHVHLNFDVFEPDLEAVRARWQEAGVVRLVHSCVEPSEFASIQAIAQRFEEVAFAIGLHPLDAHKWTEGMKEQILSLAGDSKVVAIGETGLDFYKADNQEQQRIVFESQVEIAALLELPVIIHCREAAFQVREVLQSAVDRYGKKITGVMHCWGGTPEETQWFQDLDFYISFSGIVTFKNAKQVQASAQMVRSDRLLIETDCPFLAPIPERGRRNEPAYVRYVADALAQLRGVSIQSIAAQTTENAKKLFNFSA